LTIKRHTYFEYLFSAKVRKRYLKCAVENKNNALCINIFMKMLVVLKNGVSLRLFMSYMLLSDSESANPSRQKQRKIDGEKNEN